MARIDPAQLGNWYDRWAAQLALYARGWLDPALAEDVVQEVFIRLMAGRKEPDNVKAWLYRCVRNEAISQLRKGKHRKKLNEQLGAQLRGDNRDDWFENHPDDLIDAQAVQNVLEKLPHQQREIVMLRIWGQMTLKEVAQIIGKPISTVHSRYQAGLSAMKTKLEVA